MWQNRKKFLFKNPCLRISIVFYFRRNFRHTELSLKNIYLCLKLTYSFNKRKLNKNE